VDLVSSFDIVYASKTTEFSIKEIDIAFVADLGTLNRIPATTKSLQLFKELSMTGQNFGVKEAMALGIVSKVFDNRLELDKAIFSLANKIAEKSPVTIVGIKKTIDFIKKENIRKSLEYVKTLNMSLLFNNDIKSAVMSLMQNQKANFPKPCV